MIGAVAGIEERLSSARSPDDILSLLRETLPAATGITSVNLYFYEPSSRTLRQISPGDPEPALCPVEGPVAPGLTGLTLCFRNRALLAVDDLKRAGLAGLGDGEAGGSRRSVMYVPMFAAGELTGVLELAHASRPRAFPPSERLLMQHLANQAASVAAMLDRAAARERLRQDEQTALAGRLLADLAAELIPPLETVGRTAAAMRTADMALALPFEAIAEETGEAVKSLRRFASPGGGRSGAERIDLNALLSELVRGAGRDAARRGVELRPQLPAGSVPVLAVRAELEQALLILLAEALRAAGDFEPSPVGLRLFRDRQHAVVEVTHASRPGRYEGGTSVAGLSLAIASAILPAPMNPIFPSASVPIPMIAFPAARRADIVCGRRVPSGEVA